MINSRPESSPAEASRARRAWMERGIVGAACALVIGIYAYAAYSAVAESESAEASDNYYNLLVQGFRAGQLSLNKPVPPGFASLPDPYDPTANAAYRAAPYGLHDMSYYKGRLYIYFGVTPALTLFWPYLELTGHFLSYGWAGVSLCSVGFLASAYLLLSLWRRYFAEVHVAVVAAGILTFGLATGALVMLVWCGVWEVATGCAYAFTMLALAAIWKALHESRKRSQWWWLAAASLAYGLAVGARPSLLFGAAVLLAPVVQALRERRPPLAPLLAAMAPITMIGLGLMLYNELRFDSPFEFGFRYQLAKEPHLARQFFSPRYLWFNFRIYLLQPANWSGRFPFVLDITVPPVPTGHEPVERPFGVLTNFPVVWLALAVPLAWRGRLAEAHSTLCGFLTAVGVLLGISTVTLSLFFCASIRYEAEFLPILALLAVVGLFSVERALARQPRNRMSRCAARWGWRLLLGFSVAFTLLASVERCADAHHNLGHALVYQGRLPEAIGQYEQALRLKPDFVEAYNNLGLTQQRAGQIQEAIVQYEQALRLKPGIAETHNNLGLALVQLGRLPEAISHYEQALRIKPHLADAHNNLGLSLVQLGRLPEAISQYEQALRLTPNDAGAHFNLGNALRQTGRLPAAIAQYEQALRLKPDYAEARVDLGVALMAQRRLPEAISQYEQALHIKPDSLEAHINLGNALRQAGRLPEAISHYEQAVHLRPDSAEAHSSLGNALVQDGRVPEAIEHWQHALQINPDLAETHYNLAVALEKLGRTQEAIQHYQLALRLKPDFIQAQNSLGRLRDVQ